MTEVHDEAERIVREVGSGRRNAMPHHESEDHYIARYRALVAALAAAIEENDAEIAAEALRHDPRKHGKATALERLASARSARRDALSALRTWDTAGTDPHTET